MASIRSRRLRAAVIHADHTTLVALEALVDYRPHSPDQSPAAILVLSEEMEQAQQAEIRARNAYKAARTTAIAAEWAVHNALLSAKTEVIGQYGADSNAVQSLGLKRKSEHKRPTRRKIVTSEHVNGDKVSG